MDDLLKFKLQTQARADQEKEELVDSLFLLGPDAVLPSIKKVLECRSNDEFKNVIANGELTSTIVEYTVRPALREMLLAIGDKLERMEQERKDEENDD